MPCKKAEDTQHLQSRKIQRADLPISILSVTLVETSLDLFEHRGESKLSLDRFEVLTRSTTDRSRSSWSSRAKHCWHVSEFTLFRLAASRFSLGARASRPHRVP